MRLRNKLAPVLKSEFLRNVGILTGGTLFAQALAVLALPFLTRLYTPADFSLLAVYVAVMSVVTVISCLRYNIAIPIPEEDADGIALLIISLACATAVSLLIAIPILLAPETIGRLLGQPLLQHYLWMIPVGVFFASAYNALQYWSSRKKRFGLVTHTRVMRAVGGIGAQGSIGAVSASPFGLIFGHMLYGGLGVVGLARNLWREDQSTLKKINRARIFQQAHAHRRFPMWSVPEALFNTAGVQLPVIMIAASTVGPEAGYLLLAMRVMGLPMGLIGSSVAQVFLVEAPEKYKDGTLSTFTRQTMWTLFRTGAPPLIVIGAISPFLFPMVFGAEWARAGWLVAWMTPWFVLQFVASPVSMILHVTGRVAVAMWLQVFGFALRVGLVFMLLSVDESIISEVYSATGAIFYAIYLTVICALIRKAK